MDFETVSGFTADNADNADEPLKKRSVSSASSAVKYFKQRRERETRNSKLETYKMQTFTSIPFKTESEHGLSQVNGVAKFSSAGIVLEFESKLFGLIGGGVKEVRISKDEILDVKFRRGLFKRSAKIEIRTVTFTKLAELPSSDGKLTLKLVRDDVERGQDAVERLQKDLAEYNAGLPPPQTPVSQLFDDESEDETRELS